MDKKEPKIKILVACHKADPAIRQDDIYMPIHVGKALHPELDLGFQGDDTGDNISEKNGSYCELTAMYWAWKNLPKDVDIVGLCHYRRYLDITSDKICKILCSKDAVLPIPISLSWSLDRELALWTSLEDVYILVDQLRATYPDFKDKIKKFFFESNKFYRYNMFVMKREDFSDYCSFLFDVLEKFEKVSREYQYSRQRRVYGYIGEILLGLWIYMYNRKVCFKDVLAPDNRKIRFRISNLRNAIIFNIWNMNGRKPLSPVIAGLINDGYDMDTYNVK